jgi:hypothetical protein
MILDSIMIFIRLDFKSLKYNYALAKITSHPLISLIFRSFGYRTCLPSSIVVPNILFHILMNVLIISTECHGQVFGLWVI